MSPEQYAGLIAALAALVTAVGGVYVQLRQTHSLVNGRMQQLIDTTKLAAQKDGELAGRDFERATAQAGPSESGKT